MELMQLKYFQIVAVNQHITRSAEQLGVTQPVVSNVIARLENELGVPLFERSGRSVVLNSHGRAFLERVNRILLEVDNAKADVADLTRQRECTVRVAVTSPMFLRRVTLDFMQDHAETRWKQRVCNLEEMRKLLETGQTDICIASPGVTGLNIETVLLAEEEYLLAVHPSHPFAQLESVTLPMIAKEDYIALQPGLQFRTQTDLIFQEYGLEPNVVMECDHVLRREMIYANAGVTMTSLSAKYRNLYAPQTRFLPIQGLGRKREMVLSYHRDRVLPQITRRFCAYLREYYRNMQRADKARDWF